MGLVSSPRAMMVMPIIAILIVVLGVASTTPVVAAAKGGTDVAMEGFSFGGGIAGRGSIAFAAFFASATHSGVGGFSGALSFSGGGVTFDVLGVFSIISACKGETIPSCKGQTIPALSCGVAGEVALLGTVTTGSLLGLRVLVLGCVGTNVPVEVFYGGPYEPFAYSGKGTGSVAAYTSRILAGAINAGTTSGAGTGGTGNLYVDEVLVAFEHGDSVTMTGGGAFVGTLDGVLVAGVHSIEKFSGQGSCTATLSGGITAGSFIGGQVTTSATLLSCPPTSSGPQPVTEGVRLLATPDNVIYSGNGFGLAGSIPFIGGVL